MLGWTNLIFGEILVPKIWVKMLLPNEIAGFLNQLYFQNKISLYILIEKYWGGRDYKWVSPLWSQNSKISCISRRNFNGINWCFGVLI